ncbi:MAG: hypothetical protein GC157_01015 [Frankiales bacterium]|nr:hypothetical protein [Frankiales bacterium]
MTRRTAPEVAALRRLDPDEAAARISAWGDDRWTEAFLAALQSRVRSAPLERLMTSWDLSSSDLARVFGVSRQAVSKWRGSGVPAERAVAVADLSAATDVLERYVRPERIPAVVRRPADLLGGRSLLQLAEAGQYDEVRRGAAAMVDLRRIQP